MSSEGDLLLRYLKPYWFPIVAIIFLHALAVYVQLELITFTVPIINEGVKQKDMDIVIDLGLMMLAMVGCLALNRLITSFLSSRVTGYVIRDIRRDLYRSILSADDKSDLDMPEGRVMTIFTSDLSSIEDYLMDILNTHTYIPLLLIGLLIYTIDVDYRFTFIMIGVFIVISLIVWYTGKRLSGEYMEQQRKMDRVNEILKEDITGTRTIRSNNRVDYQREKFTHANDEFGKKNRIVNLGTYFLQPLTTTIMNVSVVFICMLLALEADESMMEAGSMLVLFQYVTYFLMCVTFVPFLSTVIPRTLVITRRINRILKVGEHCRKIENEQHPDRDHDIVLSVDSATVSRDGEIILSDMDLTLSKGELVAIVGSNISGMDFLAPAIMGLSEISKGSISLGGADVSNTDSSEIRDFISYVADRAQMFRDTFQHNIDPAGTCDPVRVEDAIDASRFRDVVESSPDRMDTMVTNEGNSLSGGQRQKLAIARCLAKDSSLYIFDRCFHSLDLESKIEVIKGIRRMTADRAALIITNNVSLVNKADRIYVMDDGKIISYGNHENLISSCPEYRKLFIDEGWSA